MPGAGATRPCVLGCQGAEDRIEHYAHCRKIWAFMRQPRPHGLGVGEHYRTLQGFLLAERGMPFEDKLAMAVAVYAVSRTVEQASGSCTAVNTEKLMRLHAQEGLRGSKARKYLKRSA